MSKAALKHPTQIDPFDIATHTPHELFNRIKTRPSGLTSPEAHRRQAIHGHNTLSDHVKGSAVITFLKSFTNPLILVLLAIVTISILLNDFIDAGIVLAMVLLSVSLDFIQEHQASQAALKLNQKIALTCTVKRDHKDQEIKAKDITIGDILILNAGDLIPADARLIQVDDVFINESSLTGESFPQPKQIDALPKKIHSLSQLSNMVFAGTSVVTGSATAVVTAIGSHTQFGHIAQHLNEPPPDNDFIHGIKQFSNFIVRVVIVFVIVIFFLNLILKGNLITSFEFAIAVAVGLTPEFLPMVMSVAMSKGALQMSKKGVIVKKLASIPSFGSMDVLCTDKTGTLTQDKIALVKHVNSQGEEDESVFRLAYINSSYESGITNPLDEAIRNHKRISLNGVKKIDEIPFDFIRKRLSVVAAIGSHSVLITKGAPEETLSLCNSYLMDNRTHPFTAASIKQVKTLFQQLSGQGFRVLAIASKKFSNSQKVFSKNDEKDLVFVGFAAFLDPVKIDARDAIQHLEESGIEVKVITGDNEIVAKKACLEADIRIKGVLIGHQIDKLSDKELSQKIEKTTLFARFSPDQKLRVISLLKQNNHVVGYLGDGINDAPSLQAADVGISVSNAVDVAKEAASIILTKKSLHTLHDGVIEGRKTFGNTMKYIHMGISSNFGNMVSLLVATVFLPFLPMLPIQILLNNFLYDLSQLTIPVDTVDNEYLSQPKRWDLNSIKKFMFTIGPISSVFDLITFYLLYRVFALSPSGFQTGWFLLSVTTQTLVIHIIRTRRVPFIQSTPSPFLLLSTFGVLIIGWLIPLTYFGHYFDFIVLPTPVLLSIIGISGVYFFTAQVGKTLLYKLSANNSRKHL